MGMLDSSAKLSIAQAVTSTGDTASTNTYDNGSAHSAEMGLFDHIWLNVLCSTTATSGGAATLTPVLQHSDDGSTWTDAEVGPALALASLKAGATLWQTRPPVGTKRYIRVVYRVGTAALTAGKFEAFLSFDVQSSVARPSGFTVG